MLKRYLEEQIREDLNRKMVFMGGPRQSGKTTLAKKFGPKESYLNWDYPGDRSRILKLDLPATSVWIFDEIHKYKNWRNHLKGLYDKFGDEKEILVTGSARLDLLRRGGDSLQGRYHFLRLYPLTLDELKSPSKENLNSLLQLSGFPEPFLGGTEKEAKRWSQEYRQRVLEEDISSVELIEDLGKAEHLLLNLPERVGSPLSLNSLREDLNVSHRAIKRWIEIFEKFYAIFTIQPFGARGLRSLKKERKHYHFDWTVIKEPGPRFESLVACHLLKWAHFIADTEGRKIELMYFRDTDKREVDFVVCEENRPLFFLEAKYSQTEVSSHLRYIKRKFPNVPCYQIHFEGQREYVDAEKIEVLSAQRFLSQNRIK